MKNEEIIEMYRKAKVSYMRDCDILDYYENGFNTPDKAIVAGKYFSGVDKHQKCYSEGGFRDNAALAKEYYCIYKDEVYIACQCHYAFGDKLDLLNKYRNVFSKDYMTMIKYYNIFNDNLNLATKYYNLFDDYIYAVEGYYDTFRDNFDLVRQYYTLFENHYGLSYQYYNIFGNNVNLAKKYYEKLHDSIDCLESKIIAIREYFYTFGEDIESAYEWHKCGGDKYVRFSRFYTKGDAKKLPICICVKLAEAFCRDSWLAMHLVEKRGTDYAIGYGYAITHGARKEPEVAERFAELWIRCDNNGRNKLRYTQNCSDIARNLKGATDKDLTEAARLLNRKPSKRYLYRALEFIARGCSGEVGMYLARHVEKVTDLLASGERANLWGKDLDSAKSFLNAKLSGISNSNRERQGEWEKVWGSGVSLQVMDWCDKMSISPFVMQYFLKSSRKACGLCNILIAQFLLYDFYQRGEDSSKANKIKRELLELDHGTFYYSGSSHRCWSDYEESAKVLYEFLSKSTEGLQFINEYWKKGKTAQEVNRIFDERSKIYTRLLNLLTVKDSNKE